MEDVQRTDVLRCDAVYTGAYVTTFQTSVLLLSSGYVLS